MARYSHNFTPVENKTVAFSAGTTAQQVQFTSTIGTGGAATPSTVAGYIEFPSALQITNKTTTDVFVAWGTDNSVTATSASYAVASGAILIIDVGQSAFVSVFPAASSTGNVYLARGLGH